MLDWALQHRTRIRKCEGLAISHKQCVKMVPSDKDVPPKLVSEAQLKSVP